MDKKFHFKRIVAIIIIVNAAGFLLKNFNLNPYIILAGFRFHLSLFLPLLLLYKAIDISEIKKIFTHHDFNKITISLVWIILPLILLLVILYFTHKIEIGEPEYFYEFGISSIIDYPVYLIWNFPQLLMFGLFLILIKNHFKRYSLIIISLVIILLFAYEFISLRNIKMNYSGISILVFSSLIASILVKYFQNIYWFAVIIFSTFWLVFLSFGSKSEEMINLLFAATYNSWEGFFNTAKSISECIVPLYFLISLLILSFSAYIKSRKI